MKTFVVKLVVAVEAAFTMGFMIETEREQSLGRGLDQLRVLCVKRMKRKDIIISPNSLEGSK